MLIDDRYQEAGFGNDGSEIIPRAFDLLDLDYSGASQITWYVGDDGMVHACANNVLRSSDNLADTTGWTAASGSTVVTANTIDFQSTNQGIYQNLPGTSNRFLGKAGETLSYSLEVEVLTMTQAGNLSLRYANVSGSEVTTRSDYQLTAVGQRVQMFMTFTPSGTPTPRLWIQNRNDLVTAFQGKVKVRNLCLSVGVKTFPYIKTTTTGAVYKYRNGRFLRGWNGTAWVSTKAVELNSGEGGMRGIFEGVATTNLVTGHRGSTWTPTRATWAISSVVDPSGANNAGRLTEDTTVTSTHLLSLNLTLSDNTTYTVSGYFKGSDRDIQLLLLRKDGTFAYVTANPLTGEIGVTQNASGVVMRSLSNGWFFISFNTSSLTGGSTPLVRIQLRGLAGGGATYTGDGVSSIDFWGLGVSAQSHVSQPILTYGSTVTRAAEAPTSTALAGKSRTGKGTVEMEVVGGINSTTTRTVVEFGRAPSSATSRKLVTYLQDTDGDGDYFVGALNRDGAGNGLISVAQSLVGFIRLASVLSWSPVNDTVVMGAKSSSLDASSSLSDDVDVGYDQEIRLANSAQLSAGLFAAFRYLRYIADAALSQAACLARAITVYNQ